jgi:hypothetical protein
MKPRTTFDPRTSQYCCPVIIDTEEPAGTPWTVAYVDIDRHDSGSMAIDVTEIIAPDGSAVDLASVDLEWIADQCRDALADASRDDSLLYKVRAA